MVRALLSDFDQPFVTLVASDAFGGVSDVVSDPVVIRIAAVLRGTGRVALCVLEMWQEESSSGQLLTRGRITDEPLELPEGRYDLEFCKRTIRARKYRGVWELNFPATDEEFNRAA